MIYICKKNFEERKQKPRDFLRLMRTAEVDTCIRLTGRLFNEATSNTWAKTSQSVEW